jgi:Fe-S cluster assembly ATP-binding protein
MALLDIKNLKAKIGEQEILKGVNLSINPREVHVLMGPNGSGKTTLAYALMGKNGIAITSGVAKLNKQNLLALKPEERFKLGLFLGFQEPKEVPGVSIFSVMRLALRQGEAHSIPFLYEKLKETCEKMGLLSETAGRSLNEGFSGGEKKRLEMVQLLMLRPKIAILDEPDSGIDVDGLQILAKQIKEMIKNFNLGVLVITHAPRLLNFLKPDKVHVFVAGKVVAEGGLKMAEKIDKEGYKNFAPC